MSGLTDGEVAGYVAALKRMRDDYLADAKSNPSIRVEREAMARAVDRALESLHNHSDGRYGEPYPAGGV